MLREESRDNISSLRGEVARFACWVATVGDLIVGCVASCSGTVVDLLVPSA